jgi:hypothetical protein
MSGLGIVAVVQEDIRKTEISVLVFAREQIFNDAGRFFR